MIEKRLNKNLSKIIGCVFGAVEFRSRKTEVLRNVLGMRFGMNG